MDMIILVGGIISLFFVLLGFSVCNNVWFISGILFFVCLIVFFVQKFIMIKCNVFVFLLSLVKLIIFRKSGIQIVVEVVKWLSFGFVILSGGKKCVREDI